ncbi:isopentenyl-diphosphate Delta-isomerase [Pseudomonas fluorescens]|uniref:isopentenyl-diphosphate Delta-isomerase n=1 Tax=Pseudomonas fluorescens TaxID=294 RepID=UPI001BED3814|nr:isopentenyl-diphosphate Delta-isomerase [Pseudomonas fluorescens]MBT2375338.1 isopentenyl-diphosphate Delta-isomerase [Pseudomonas fluorescens]
MIETLVLVDEGGNEIGRGEKLKVHQDGLLHRAFSIFIFDLGGRLLLQQRAFGKYHSGGLWTNTCCGHPRPGESTSAAAHRRLHEEMGFDCELDEVTTLVYREPVPSDDNLVEHEFDHVFVGVFNSSPSPDASEASDWKWAEIEPLLLEMETEPGKFTVWFRKIVNELDTQAGNNWLAAQSMGALEAVNGYQNKILPRVSRTFALTIPQLPPGLCTVVANAYLLCRIADTIEDEPALTSQQKFHYEHAFIDVVAGRANAESFSRELSNLLTDRTLEAERDLVRNLPLVLQVYGRLNPVQKNAIVDCLEVMGRGMSLFQGESSLNGLATRKDLDRYCYCVAGVVGEMLTTLFIDFDASLEAQRTRLLRLSVSTGIGLQLTNILKDRWDDEQRGVCWLPRDLFARHAAPGQPDFDDARAISELIGTAHAHLRLALDYALLIPANHVGIRCFVLWAVGFALLTLQKIHLHPGIRRGDQYKVSHQDVGRVMNMIRLYAHSDASLRTLFKAASRGLPLTALNVEWNQHISPISTLARSSWGVDEPQERLDTVSPLTIGDPFSDRQERRES